MAFLGDFFVARYLVESRFQCKYQISTSLEVAQKFQMMVLDGFKESTMAKLASNRF